MENTNNIQRDKQDGWVIDREHLIKLHASDIQKTLDDSRFRFEVGEFLESFSCVQLENIEVDLDSSDCVSASTYFQPSGPIDDQLKQLLSRAWFELSPGQAPRLYPENRAAWLTTPWEELGSRKRGEVEIDRFGGSAWRFLDDDPSEILDQIGLVLPMGFSVNCQEYNSQGVFLPKDEKKPHLSCIISDTLESDTILQSEIHGAFFLITYRMAIKRFSDHRTKPVMLYTIQGDLYARITQAYFDPDMGKIVLRQSRLLDLNGSTPTEDAWLLMRWMLNTPVGDTLFKTENGDLPVRVKEPAASPLEPTTATAA